MYIDKEYQELTIKEFDGIFALCSAVKEISPYKVIYAYYYNRIANHNEQINIKLFYCLRYTCKKLIKEIGHIHDNQLHEVSIYKSIIDFSNALIKKWGE